MPRRSPLVIYYHSVAPAPFEGWTLRFLTMELRRFEDQMNYIAERGWRSVFLDEWWAMRNGLAASQGNEICITFDDGLLDNWVHAYPVVKRLGLRMTVFVCPELIEPTDRVRPTMEDVRNGRCAEKDLVDRGHLSWGELRAMQRSGHVDIQSHTMSHAKYIVSDVLRGFHYGGFEGHYPLMNATPLAEKPFYMSDPAHTARLPMGTPLFVETSSVVAIRREIDPGFLDEVRTIAAQHDLARPKDRLDYEQRVRSLHASYRSRDALVVGTESFAAQVERVEYEIIGSKQVLEKELGKPVEFLCWPHGDNHSATHAVARQAGYKATSVGRMHGEMDRADRIPRIGTDWPGNARRVRMKFNYKMASHLGRQPYRAIADINRIKNDLLGRY